MSYIWFRLVKRLDDGLVVISRMGQEAMWTQRKLRKPCNCEGTGRLMAKGELAYGPLGNQQYRMERLSAAYVAKLMGAPGKHDGRQP